MRYLAFAAIAAYGAALVGVGSEWQRYPGYALVLTGVGITGWHFATRKARSYEPLVAALTVKEGVWWPDIHEPNTNRRLIGLRPSGGYRDDVLVRFDYDGRVNKSIVSARSFITWCGKDDYLAVAKHFGNAVVFHSRLAEVEAFCQHLVQACEWTFKYAFDRIPNSARREQIGVLYQSLRLIADDLNRVTMTTWDSPEAIFQTSGSVGVPVGISFSHAMLLRLPEPVRGRPL